MASNVTVQSVLGKISQDHLECYICSDRFKEPKVLDCLHSFCLKCLKELRQCQEGTGLTCPLCRCETILKGNGVADLPNNFTLGALVEEFTMQEQLLEGQGSEVKCQNCDEENAAVSRCIDCESFLCLECEKAHQRMAAMKSHEVNTLGQLQSGEVSYKSKLREEIPKCVTHPGQNLSIYCNTCQQLVCTTCSILEHAQHSLVGQTEALDKCKQEISELIAKAEKTTTAWSNATKKAEEAHETLQSMFADTFKKISEKANEEMTRIKEEESKLKEEAVKIYTEGVKTLDTAQAANSQEVTQREKKLDDVKQLMAQASCSEILDLKQKLLHNLRGLTKKRPQKVTLSVMDFEEGEKSLSIGRLVLQDERKPESYVQATEPPKPTTLHATVKWQKKTEIYKFGESKTAFQSASDVAVFSNNEIVIVDIECKHLITFLPKEKKKPAVSKELEITDLHNPRRVAVNKDDELIVLAGPIVKSFSREYFPINYFRPGGSKKSNNNPTCLAVDGKNHIAVGYATKEEIALHKPDGSFIKIVSAPGICDHLVSYNYRFSYTNFEEFELRAIDEYGIVQSSEKISSLDNLFCDLRGLCCDHDGSIYVAVSRETETDEIYHFSPDGKYQGRAIKGCNDVSGITITPRGDLVAAAEKSVMIYRRV